MPGSNVKEEPQTIKREPKAHTTHDTPDKHKTEQEKILNKIMSGLNSEKKRDKKKKKKHKKNKNKGESAAVETDELLSDARASSGDTSGEKLIFN